MKQTYAINETSIYQLRGSEWMLINDETGEADIVVDNIDLDRDEFTIFEDEFDACQAKWNEDFYGVRDFIITSASEYLGDN